MTASFFSGPPTKTYSPRHVHILDKATEREKDLGRDLQDNEKIIFAAGCFWGIELAFQRVPGVGETSVGYTNGHAKDPTYEAVCGGSTGHTEAVHVAFDRDVVQLKELLDLFWDIHDPTTLNQQGNDVGTQYRSGIYYYSDQQEKIIHESLKQEQGRLVSPIVTEIVPASEFYVAEEYHQSYLKKGGQCSLKGDKTAIRCYG
jgi:peptide-methionine (S)-S-oxide reductase